MRILRSFLLLAALWDVTAAAALLLTPQGRAGVGEGAPAGRTRAFGGIVLAFGLLYGALALRPVRPLLAVSAVAKTVGATSGAVGLVRGQRDLVTVVSIADTAWILGFVAGWLLRRPGR
jgi:hypothetical protein